MANADEATDHDDIVSLLIDLGMLETAVADALFPKSDGECATTIALRQASVSTGRLLRHSWRAERERTPREARRLVAQLVQKWLFPQRSICASRRGMPITRSTRRLFASGGTIRRTTSPGLAVCIGLRSIGTSLSACVAAELEAQGWQVESITLCPRGHPFARRPELDDQLTNKLHMLCHAAFLVVDEGPGLSGSSFAGTATLLSDLGVAADRICLFPGSLPDPEGFISAAAREAWSRHRKIHVSFEGGWLPQAHFGTDLVDVSGGGWRDVFGLSEPEWPAVDPRHERRKYVTRQADGRRVLHKFAGLGRYGSNAYKRGLPFRRGITPAVTGLKQGFFQQELVPGRPHARGAVADKSSSKRHSDILGIVVRIHLPNPSSSSRCWS